MLSQRLQTLAGYYHDAESVWDIGCDHGLLGLSLIDQPLLKQLHLVDPSQEVIETLHKKLLDSYITKGHLIKVHHQKGQELTLGPERKIVFVAGMGGKEIQQILLHLEAQLEEVDRLVISPHRNILELREYLGRSRFGLFEERLMREDGQFYQILILEKKPQLPRVHAFGEGIWRGEEGQKYREHLLAAFQKHKDPRSLAFVEYLKQLSN